MFDTQNRDRYLTTQNKNKNKLAKADHALKHLALALQGMLKVMYWMEK